MIDIVIERKEPVNSARLHEELAAALGGRLVGVSAGPAGIVRVHLSSVGAGEADLIRAAVERHDPAVLTADQARQADRAAQWERLRKPWAEWTAGDKDGFLRALAEQAGLRVE